MILEPHRCGEVVILSGRPFGVFPAWEVVGSIYDT